jgi:hypothetical protein
VVRHYDVRGDGLGLGFRDSWFGFRVSGFWFRMLGFGFRVSGIWGSGFGIRERAVAVHVDTVGLVDPAWVRVVELRLGSLDPGFGNRVSGC